MGAVGVFSESVGPELTLVVADEQVATRVGIRTAVEADGLRVVAEASTAAEAVERCLEHRPDVCLMVTHLPGNARGAVELIKRSVPGAKIIMMTASGRSDELFGALRAGADGYLPMTTSASRLPHAIRGVARGEAALPRDLTIHLVREFRERGHRRRVELSPGHDVELTAREFEVLECLRKRERTAEVAAHLGITEITVRRHVSSLVRKLGASDRSEILEMLERSETSNGAITT
jgi:two-component system, NarL family, nitrate/nitrite response regulator NarL